MPVQVIDAAFALARLAMSANNTMLFLMLRFPSIASGANFDSTLTMGRTLCWSDATGSRTDSQNCPHATITCGASPAHLCGGGLFPPCHRSRAQVLLPLPRAGIPYDPRTNNEM